MTGRHALLILISITGLVVSCSDVRLAQPNDGNQSNGLSKGEFCLNDPEDIRPVTKVLFIVDKSYSNTLVLLPDGGTLPGNDPGAQKRGETIDKVVRKNAGKDYYRYGLVAFIFAQGDAYTTDPQTGKAGFTPNPDDMFKATQKLRDVADDGETPFIEGLETSLKMIKSDQQDHKDEKSRYVVIFLSDGIPTVGQSDNRIFDLVREIKTAGGDLVFNTGFYGDYGNYTQNAKDRLKEMARIGDGKFFDFNTSTDWDFDDYFDLPTKEPYFMARFLVYNLAAGFCLDGSIDTDSDADGLCDKDETAMKDDGFDPQNRFSFNDGYSDYFHWRTFKWGENLPPCADRTDEDHDLLTFCEEKYLKNESAKPEIGKTGNPKSFDTDRDGVIDGIETLVFFPDTLAFAMDDHNLPETYDGEESADYQITQHRNPLVRDAQAVSYDSTVTPIMGRKRECFNHTQSRLSLYPTLPVRAGNTLPGLEHGANENPVFVYFVQRMQKAPREEGILKYSVQKLKHDPNLGRHNSYADLLKISDDIFSSYTPPKR